MADLDVGFRLVFLQLAVSVDEEYTIVFDIVFCFVILKASPCMLFFDAGRIVIHKCPDFLNRQQGVHILSLVCQLSFAMVMMAQMA